MIPVYISGGQRICMILWHFIYDYNSFLFVTAIIEITDYDEECFYFSIFLLEKDPIIGQ
jgi:hypothetical protein